MRRERAIHISQRGIHLPLEKDKDRIILFTHTNHRQPKLFSTRGVHVKNVQYYKDIKYSIYMVYICIVYIYIIYISLYYIYTIYILYTLPNSVW